MQGSIQQLARRAGVSVATVSRVFNKRPYVRPELRQKILKLAREMHYVPRLTARKETIAIIVEGTDGIVLGRFESYLIMPLSQLLIRHGLHFQIIPVSELDLIHENFIRAAIVIVHHGVSYERARQLRGLPVIMNHDCPGVLTIRSDHQQGAELACEYLLKLGHRRIGLLVTSLSPGGPSSARVEGYRAALGAAQVPIDNDLIQATNTRGHFEGVAKLLSAAPTAVIAAGEGAALPAAYVLQLLGKRVPDDVSLITYEQHDISPFLFPSHTTIAQDFAGLAQAYITHLVRILEGEQPESIEPILIPNQLIVRDSTRPI